MPSAIPEQGPAPGPAPAAVLLTSAAASAVVGVLVVVAVLVGLGHTESAERTAYSLGLLAAAVVTLPAVIALTGRLGTECAAAAGAVAIALVTVLLALSRGLHLGLPGVAAAGVAGAVLLAGAPWIRKVLPGSAALPFIVAGAIVAGSLAFAGDAALATGRAMVAVAAGLLIAAAVGRRSWPAARATPRTALLALELAFGVGAALLAADITFRGDMTTVHHHGFFLGPVNDVLNGRTMLVDTFSQYGVGDIYALALVFSVVPLGIGTMELLLAILTATQVLVIMLTVRLAGGGRLVAAASGAFYLVVVVFGQIDSPTTYPSTGFLRFGLPWIAIIVGLAAWRSEGRRRTALWGVELATVAVAGVWAVEAAATTVAVVAVLVAASAVVSGRPPRVAARSAAVQLAAVVGALVTGFMTLTLLTKVFAGTWPHYGTYFDMVSEYAASGFGSLLIPEWSVGLVVGWISVASLVAVAALAFRARAWVMEHRFAYLAIAGLATHGLLSYQYFLSRSHPNNILHVAPPVIALVAVWVALTVRGIGLPTARGAVVGAVGGAAVLAALPALPAVKDKWPRTALAAMIPGGGGGSAIAAVEKLWKNPATNEGIQQTMEMVERHRRPVVMLLAPEASLEVLLRARRNDALPVADAAQDVLSPRASRRVVSAARRLPPGAVMITDGATRRGQTDPALNALQVEVLGVLRERFRWRTLDSTPGGVVAVALEPRA